VFPDQIIYTANGDLTTLNAILNAVAMVCQDGITVWGFALVAATWSLLSMTTTATVGAASGGAGADLAKRAIGLLIPFCLAIFLTTPAMKTRVTVESGLTGATTTVDNVPVLISFVPATGSLISKIVGAKLETAMQATGTDYASISASGKGFINPLKTLLTSRTAVLRLGGIASEVNSILSACLNADSGANYPQIASHVLFAGNLGGANAGPAPIQVYSGAGSAPTSIGVLLAEAAQNTSGIVTDIPVGNNHFASCADAATQVGADIESALRSDEFRRVVQGAVNSADQPNANGDYSIDSLAAQYTAIRTANTTTNTLAGGVAQANAEVINLLFSELVKNDLDCLRADSTNKSTCLAMAVQANEIERNNIQQAANGFESLMYAGAFANQITAVVIALGPVIILFMMFSGVGAARNMKVAAHMIVWPLLIMNVGAELINGMIYIQVANFMRALAQDGFINQSTAVEVYKHFSLEVGTASHLMATLPILMTTIFALGESAALVKISESMGSNTKDESQAANPPPVNSAPLVTNSSVAKAEQGIGGVDLSLNGAIPAIAASAQFGNMQREASNSLTSAHQKMQSISEGETDLQSWTKAFSTGDFKKLGVSESTFKALRDEYSRNYNAIQSGKAGHGVTSSKDNYNSTQDSAGAELSAGAGAPGGKAGGLLGASAGIGGSIGHRTTTGANDNMQAGRRVEQDDSVAKSQALAKSFSTALQSDRYKNMGTDETRSLQHSLGVQRQYAKTRSESKSMSEVASDAVRRSSNFVALNAQIGGKEVANQMKTNPEYQRFQLNQGRLFEKSAAAQPYLERAKHDMESGGTDRIVGDDQAKDAMTRHRAAFLLAADEHAKPADRLAADEYLLGSANAMLAVRFTAADLKPRPHYDIAAPADHSGVNGNALVKHVTPAPKGKASKHGKAVRHEKTVAEQVDAGYHFATDVGRGIEGVSTSVLAERQGGERAAAHAGLAGADGPGTNHRAMSNIGANVSGDKSRTELPTKP
jgi:conjugal transfer mating pair stabilization protein TraG